ncbi:hypothetical protein OH77DRAFT_1497146 [Trametes cingulata]|nr:hypothetical protein OH77DRAFT_1497146 [Trametes cingulata]
MNVVKALLLATTAEMFVSVVAPPKRATAGKESIYKGQVFEFLVRYLAYLGCFLVSASAFSHSMLIFYRDGTSWIEPVVPWLCPSAPPTLDPLLRMTPRFLVGVALVAVGTTLRIGAYRALGALFTFEVVLKEDHRLVTGGPYKFIRHPSYTGIALLLLGTHLIHFGQTGYVTYCDLDATPMAIFVNIWRLGSLFTVLSLYRRCGIEDAQLRERFGAEWDMYNKEVPYALAPYVY